MRNRASFTLIRLAGPLFGLLLAGTALAAPKDGSSNDGKADCYSRAALQYNIDFAQCAGYPAGSDADNFCQVQAAQNYAQAVTNCGTDSAAIVKHPGPTFEAPLRQIGGRTTVRGEQPKDVGAPRFTAPRSIVGIRRR